jgi:hypothetical protein
MSRWRPGEASSVPVLAARAFSALSEPQPGLSLGGIRLVTQTPIGSPMHAARLSRKRFHRVVAPAELHLDHLRSARCALCGNLLLARVDQPKAVPTGERFARPVKNYNAPATDFSVEINWQTEAPRQGLYVISCRGFNGLALTLCRRVSSSPWALTPSRDRTPGRHRAAPALRPRIARSCSIPPRCG